MKILILNIGSSSLKYSIYEDKRFLEKGNIDKIGEKDGSFKDHGSALKDVLADRQKIDVIGHRIVHGGEIRDSCVIDEEILCEIKEFSRFAPLHNPPEIAGIEIAQGLMPGVPQVAIFDTAFHSTIPEKAYLYAMPYEYYSKERIRRYGFHGSSHKFVSRGIKGKVITCHLGNGCSIAAIRNGKCQDTSMGLTPLEGLIMGTRSGDVDPGALIYLMESMNKDEIGRMLNKQSGLLGISGSGNDVRELLEKMKMKDKRACLALDMFCYRIQKYIGSYAAVLNGADAIVFTGGIGENAYRIRKKILDNLTYLGVKIDNMKNKKNERVVSSEDSEVRVMVIPTNEELMMAEECVRVLRK